jgi:hypothetical protein
MNAPPEDLIEYQNNLKSKKNKESKKEKKEDEYEK